MEDHVKPASTAGRSQPDTLHDVAATPGLMLLVDISGDLPLTLG